VSNTVQSHVKLPFIYFQSTNVYFVIREAVSRGLVRAYAVCRSVNLAYSMTSLAGLRLARVSCVPGAGRGPGGRSHGLNTRHRSTRDSTRDRIRQPVCSILMRPRARGGRLVYCVFD
jgi:hypothetical protein